MKLSILNLSGLSNQVEGRLGTFHGFTTASGGALKTPSREALLKARRLVDDSAEEANESILYKGKLLSSILGAFHSSASIWENPFNLLCIFIVYLWLQPH